MNGRRPGELVLEPAPATKDTDQQVALPGLTSNGDHDLDMEVSSFLESEFFAAHGLAIVSSPQHEGVEASSTTPMLDELLFKDTDEPKDTLDLNLDDGRHKFQDLQKSTSRTADDELCLLFQPPAATDAADVSELPSSLRVVIPASALLSPLPSIRRQRKVKAPTPTLNQQTKGRKRVKDELEYLRLQVQEFEDKLERLKQERASANSSPPASPSAASLSIMETEPSDFSPDPTLWERTAKRQRDEKRRSQVKNAQLKEMLEDQLQLAQSLSSVLQKREDLSWLETLDPRQSMYKQCGGATENPETAFDELAAQVETLYSELDAVLFEAGIAGGETDVHSAQVKADGDHNLFIEVVDCNTLPFDVHTTGAAIWMLMSTSSIDFESGKFQAINATDDTIHAQLTVTLRVKRLDTSVRMSLVVKRVVKADRIVFVWCAMGDMLSGECGKECVQVRECGWTIIKASTGADTDKEGKRNQHEPGTIVQNIVRMVPELEASGVTSKSTEDHVGVLTDVMLSSFQQNLAMLRQIVENIIRSDAVCTNSFN